MIRSAALTAAVFVLIAAPTAARADYTSMLPAGTMLGGAPAGLEPSDDAVGVLTSYAADEAALEGTLRRAGLGDAVVRIRFSATLARAMLVLSGPYARDAGFRAKLARLPGIRHVFDIPEIDGKVAVLPTPFVNLRTVGGIGAEQLGKMLAAEGGRIVERSLLVEDTFTVQVDDWQSVTTANRLARWKALAYAEPAFVYFYEPMFRPDDPLYNLQWHLNNNRCWGNFGCVGRAGADAKAESAWDITRGADTTIITVCDDGIDTGHPDINQLGGLDKLDGDFDPSSPTGAGSDGSPYGHGTAVSGVAAARGNNGIGVSGLCPNCRILPIRMIGNRGLYENEQIDAFIWARDRGSNIINNSWGLNQAIAASSYTTQSITALARPRTGPGIVFVWAAGNENRTISTREVQGLDVVLTVGSSTETDTRSSYSNFGPPLDVVAPSNGGYYSIVTTDIRAGGGYNRSGRYYADARAPEADTAGDYTLWFGGTSSAAPLTAGLVGLIRTINPQLTSAQVIDLVRNSADKIGGASTYNAQGRNDQMGNGRINSRKALEAAVAGAGCGAETRIGRCEGQVLYKCGNDGQLVIQDCATIDGASCKDAGDGTGFACLQCRPTPSTSCKDNIDNDCDKSVDEPAECAPDECLTAFFTPYCDGETLVGCTINDTINRVDCRGLGQTCGADDTGPNCVNTNPDCTPTPPSCRDNLDNNCNGARDEAAECGSGECIPADFADRCDGDALSACTLERTINRVDCAARGEVCAVAAEGAACAPPKPGCTPTSPASCLDTIDNNCNDAVDEAGECSAAECVAGAPARCDGTVLVTCGDNRRPQRRNCADGGQACTVEGGTADCRTPAGPACEPRNPPSCINDRDDDCNGVIDDQGECRNDECRVGAFAAQCQGTVLVACVAGRYRATDCTPLGRVCAAAADGGVRCLDPLCRPSARLDCANGIDDDCNGAVDDAPECAPAVCAADLYVPRCAGSDLQACTNGIVTREACSASGRTCLDAGGRAVCGAAPAGCTPSPGSCRDNIDNDCDGRVDEPDECAGAFTCPAGVTAAGRCEGDIAVYCGKGTVVLAQCRALGGVCAVGADGSARCGAAAVGGGAGGLCTTGAGGAPGLLLLLAAAVVARVRVRRGPSPA